MKYSKNSKPNNYLNQYSYDQIKIANKTALKILYEFVDEMFTMFSNIRKYIIKPKQLENMLKNIYYTILIISQKKETKHLYLISLDNYFFNFTTVSQ